MSNQNIVDEQIGRCGVRVGTVSALPEGGSARGYDFCDCEQYELDPDAPTRFPPENVLSTLCLCKHVRDMHATVELPAPDGDD